MNVFEYPADRLAHITYSGRQDSKKPWRNVRRIANEYICYFVVEGEVFLEEESVPYHLTKGDFLLLEPGKLHFGTEYTDCVFYYVHFLHPDMRKAPEPEEDRTGAESEHAAWRIAAEGGPFPKNRVSVPKQLHIEDRGAFLTLCNHFEQLLSRQRLRMEHFGALGACALHEIFIELERRRALSRFGQQRGERIPTLLNSVLLYLQASYGRHITSADIERELSYNFDYLNQLFAKHLHISIFKLLENIRIEAAKHFLQTSAISIGEIAREVGYSDESYFSKAFKRRTGCSPSQFRAGRSKADV